MIAESASYHTPHIGKDKGKVCSLAKGMPQGIAKRVVLVLLQLRKLLIREQFHCLGTATYQSNKSIRRLDPSVDPRQLFSEMDASYYAKS